MTLGSLAFLAFQVVAGTTLNTAPQYPPETQAKLDALKQAHASLDKGDAGAVKLIEAGLTDRHEMVRVFAGVALGHAVTVTGAASRSPIVARAIVGMRDTLMKCVDDSSDSVRAPVMTALGFILNSQDDGSVVKELTRRFQIESHPRVRTAIVTSSGRVQRSPKRPSR
jgi:hypothetical protein